MESDDVVQALHHRDALVHEAIKECAHHAATHAEAAILKNRREVELQRLCEEMTKRAREQASQT
jgi:hypothetical protein